MRLCYLADATRFDGRTIRVDHATDRSTGQTRGGGVAGGNPGRAQYNQYDPNQQQIPYGGGYQGGYNGPAYGGGYGNQQYGGQHGAYPPGSGTSLKIRDNVFD